MPNKILSYYENNGTIVDNVFECDYVQIELLGNHAIGKNAIMLISKESFELVIQFVWYLGKDGYPITHGTDDNKIKFGRGKKIHKLLMNAPKGQVIDHINRDRLDNRLTNLRICTPKENSYNRSRPKNNEYKGVVKQSNGLWTAQLTKDGQVYKIPDIVDKKLAAETYDLMAEEMFGEYAGKNFG